MKSFLAAFHKEERGQAFVEYSVTIAGYMCITLLVLIALGPGLRSAYCDAVTMFNPNACVSEADGPEEEPTEEEVVEACFVLQEEEGCSQCDQSADCACLPGLNAGTYTGSEDIDVLVIKAGRDYFMYVSGTTDDGCYEVNIDGDEATWMKVGSGKDCKDISHLQTWYIPHCSEG
jgi:hypothetical protein